jgi:hypothetical protein
VDFEALGWWTFDFFAEKGPRNQIKTRRGTLIDRDRLVRVVVIK